MTACKHFSFTLKMFLWKTSVLSDKIEKSSVASFVIYGVYWVTESVRGNILRRSEFEESKENNLSRIPRSEKPPFPLPSSTPPYTLTSLRPRLFSFSSSHLLLIAIFYFLNCLPSNILIIFYNVTNRTCLLTGLKLDHLTLIPFIYR